MTTACTSWISGTSEPCKFGAFELVPESILKNTDLFLPATAFQRYLCNTEIQGDVYTIKGLS